MHIGSKLEDFEPFLPVGGADESPPISLVWWFGDVGLLQQLLQRAASSVAWVHSGSAGVEHLLKVPEVRDEGGPPLTNAKGAFSASLGEWAIFGCMWFAKRVGEMRQAQAEVGRCKLTPSLKAPPGFKDWL